MIEYRSFRVDIPKQGVWFAHAAKPATFVTFDTLRHWHDVGELSPAQWDEINLAVRKADREYRRQHYDYDDMWDSSDVEDVEQVLDQSVYQHPIFGRLLRIDTATGTAFFDHVSKGGVEVNKASVMAMAEALRGSGAAGPNWFKEAEPKPLNVDDAATLIVETVRRDPNVRKAASKWITEMTVRISAVLKELDDAE